METSDLEAARRPRRPRESVEPRQRTLGTDKRKVKEKGQRRCLLVSYMPLAYRSTHLTKNVRFAAVRCSRYSDLSYSSTCTSLRRYKGIRMA